MTRKTALRGGDTRWLDGAAVGASGLCLLHCLALPVAVALLPGLLAGVAEAEWVHRALLLFAAPVSIAALASGYRTHARRSVPIAGALGLALMAVALLPVLHEAEAALTVAGSVLLAIAHVVNWRAQAVIRN